MCETCGATRSGARGSVPQRTVSAQRTTAASVRCHSSFSIEHIKSPGWQMDPKSTLIRSVPIGVEGWIRSQLSTGQQSSTGTQPLAPLRTDCMCVDRSWTERRSTQRQPSDNPGEPRRILQRITFPLNKPLLAAFLCLWSLVRTGSTSSVNTRHLCVNYNM